MSRHPDPHASRWCFSESFRRARGRWVCQSLQGLNFLWTKHFTRRWDGLKDESPFLEGWQHFLRYFLCQQLGRKNTQEYSTGHAFHTYTLTSSDGSVQRLGKHPRNRRHRYIDMVLLGAYTLGRLTWNMSSWRFGRSFSFLNGLICMFQPLIFQGALACFSLDRGSSSSTMSAGVAPMVREWPMPCNLSRGRQQSNQRRRHGNLWVSFMHRVDGRAAIIQPLRSLFRS